MASTSSTRAELEEDTKEQGSSSPVHTRSPADLRELVHTLASSASASPSPSPAPSRTRSASREQQQQQTNGSANGSSETLDRRENGHGQGGATAAADSLARVRSGLANTRLSTAKESSAALLPSTSRAATATPPVVVSYPPSPSSALTSSLPFPPQRQQYVPLASVSPLKAHALGQRIPLARPPPASALHYAPLESTREAKARERAKEESERRAREAADEQEARAGDTSGEEDSFPLILVTGGAGYIGSHTVLEILSRGTHGVVVLDNLANSKVEVLHRVLRLSADHHAPKGGTPPPLYFHACDITDTQALNDIFAAYATSGFGTRVTAVVHFAALKSVAESLKTPVDYYKVNVGGTANLVEVMARWRCKRLVFSSSCVVYGQEADGEGIVEEQCVVQQGGGKGITNPYGRSKRMCEEIIFDLCQSDPEWRAMLLRYTNPSGAHPSGYIGEDPTTAANLMPIVTQVLQGKRDHVMIYGADYPTPDGTGVRDFLHVVDLAKAHLAALDAMLSKDDDGDAWPRTYNLGTNKGTSVLAIVETLSAIAQRPIRIVIAPRRPGDLGCVVCSANKAERELGWKAQRGIVDMCRDLVNWQARNPEGYSVISTR